MPNANVQVFYVWMFGGSAFVAELLYRVAMRLKLFGKALVAFIIVTLIASGAWCRMCGSTVLCSHPQYPGVEAFVLPNEARNKLRAFTS
jgi:hypothetical protein